MAEVPVTINCVVYPKNKKDAPFHEGSGDVITGLIRCSLLNEGCESRTCATQLAL